MAKPGRVKVPVTLDLDDASEPVLRGIQSLAFIHGELIKLNETMARIAEMMERPSDLIAQWADAQVGTNIPRSDGW